jgi:hypothetical protein
MNYDELFNANVHAYDPLSFSMWKSPVSWREHRRAQRRLWPSPCGYPLCHSSRPCPPYLPVTWITYTKLSRNVAKVAIWDTPLDFICFICIELYWFVLILWNILQCPLASSIVSSHWVETLHESGNQSLSMSQDHSKIPKLRVSIWLDFKVKTSVFLFLVSAPWQIEDCSEDLKSINHQNHLNPFKTI